MAAAVLGVSGCSSTEEAVVIGLAAPLSEPRGQAILLGAELAVAEINARGGVLGRRIELAAQDDSGKATTAALVAQGFYDNPSIVAVLGHANSAPSLAAAGIYGGGANPLVHITPSATGGALGDLGPYSFRICPDDMAHGETLARWVRGEIGAGGTTAILYENSEQGRGLSQAFRYHFTRGGGRVTSADPFLNSTPSFEPFLSRLRVRGGADVLLIAGRWEEATRILSTLDTLGMSTRVVGGAGLSVLRGATSMADGTLISTYYLPSIPNPGNEDFVSAHRSASGGDDPDHGAAGAYDIIYLLARAVESAGSGRERLREYLSQVGNREQAFDGVTGRIAFDARGEAVDREVLTATVVGGQLRATEAR